MWYIRITNIKKQIRTLAYGTHEHPSCDVYAVHEDDRIIMYMDEFVKIFAVREISLKIYDNDDVLIF